MISSTTTIHSMNFLVEKNQEYIEHYKLNPLICLIESDAMSNQCTRNQLLNCIQVFSDYFQKTALVRCALTETPKLLAVAQQHLSEEFGHNLILQTDRKDKSPLWDAVLDATSSWFVWKMFTLNDYEKTVLMHLVLETSADLFFKKAHKVMQQYHETEYFSIHASADEGHANMGIDFLKDLTQPIYERLLEIQSKGWDVLNAACIRIAQLTVSGKA